MRPRNGTDRSPASFSPPPWPKRSVSSPHFGQTNALMFSISPIAGMLSLRYIRIARRVSATDTACGVVTSTAPATGTVWLRLSATSPVPGGMSTIR
jgi:hypothetical protein